LQNQESMEGVLGWVNFGRRFRLKVGQYCTPIHTQAVLFCMKSRHILPWLAFQPGWSASRRGSSRLSRWISMWSLITVY